MTDRERLELAEVFSEILEARMQELYAQIAAGFVEAINCLMEDLSKILEAQSSETLRRLRQQNQPAGWLDRILASQAKR